MIAHSDRLGIRFASLVVLLDTRRFAESINIDEALNKKRLFSFFGCVSFGVNILSLKKFILVGWYNKKSQIKRKKCTFKNINLIQIKSHVMNFITVKEMLDKIIKYIKMHILMY